MIDYDQISKLLDVEGYPLYIYDNQRIKERINAIHCSMPYFKLLYSMKANPLGEILDIMKNFNVGIDAASINEVMFAHRHGFCARDIYFSSPGKVAQEIESALPLCTIIADSSHELELINKICSEKKVIANIGIRLNVPNTKIRNLKTEIMAGQASKFGIDISEFVHVENLISGLEHLRVCGIHIYFGSQILAEEILEYNFKLISECASDLSERFCIDFVNFGGGFGVSQNEYEAPINIVSLGKKLLQIPKLVNLTTQNIRCNLELGRYLVAESGYYITKVVDIKESYGQKYIILKGGMNSFFRPIFTKEYHEIMQPNNENEFEKVSIAGELCTPIDEYYSDILIRKCSIGDIIVFRNAGAYGYTMSLLEFLSHKRPLQFCIGD